AGTYNLANTNVDRKLITYRATVAGADTTTALSVVVHLYGCGILVSWSENRAGSPCVGVNIAPGKWQRIETQVTLNSSMSSKDGIIRLWLNNKLIFENVAASMTNPSWRGTPAWEEWSV